MGLTKTLSTEQLQQAIAMHDSGMNWKIVATYFQLHTQTLSKQIKHYEKDRQ